MNKLLFGHDSEVADWVLRHIPTLRGAPFGSCAAIGVLDDLGNPLAGVVYHDYQQQFATMQVSMAAVSPRWATRGTIRALLSYPFLQAGINKVWAASPHTNERALKFLAGIGMKKEGVLRHQFGPKVHAVINGLTRVEFDRLFLKGNSHGQKHPVSAARA